VRKILPLDSNSRQSVIAFHGGFRDERRHVRSLYKHSDLYSWGLSWSLFAIVQMFVDRTMCRLCYAQIEHTCRSVHTCLFVSCETNSRERQDHGNRSLLHAVGVASRIEAAIIKLSADARWILIIRKLHLPVRPFKLKCYPRSSHGRASYTIYTFHYITFRK